MLGLRQGQPGREPSAACVGAALRLPSEDPAVGESLRSRRTVRSCTHVSSASGIPSAGHVGEYTSSQRRRARREFERGFENATSPSAMLTASAWERPPHRRTASGTCRPATAHEAPLSGSQIPFCGRPRSPRRYLLKPSERLSADARRTHAREEGAQPAGSAARLGSATSSSTARSSRSGQSAHGRPRRLTPRPRLGRQDRRSSSRRTPRGRQRTRRDARGDAERFASSTRRRAARSIGECRCRRKRNSAARSRTRQCPVLGDSRPVEGLAVVRFREHDGEGAAQASE